MKGHCFDLARVGYINFLSSAHKSKYTKDLFEARRRFLHNGFFDPLLSIISKWILENLKGAPLKLADVGCGEGSNLSRLENMLRRTKGGEILSVGLDISKEGIHLASKEYPRAIWCVADLAKVPFKAETFDCLVNILSPANYAEFHRVLGSEGVLIKVIPAGGYLRELRENLYQDTDREVYSNRATLKVFLNKMDFLESQDLEYRIGLNQTQIKDLLQMTPLLWGVSEDQLEGIRTRTELEITIAVKVLFGKKRQGVQELGDNNIV